MVVRSCKWDVQTYIRACLALLRHRRRRKRTGYISTDNSRWFEHSPHPAGHERAARFSGCSRQYNQHWSSQIRR